MARINIILIACILLLSVSVSFQASLWTRSYNMARSNSNLEETVLNTQNVNVNQFGKLFSRTVDGHIYAQPLFITGLRMPQDNRVHNIMFVATMANNIYAFDSDDPAQDKPLWQRNFGPSLPVSDGTIGAPSEHCALYTDIIVEVGIVSTPVIDRDTNTMYLVSTNKDSNSPYVVRHRLHAIDILTGQDRPNSPKIIEGEFPGTGDGSVNGVIKFTSITQNQRSALTLIDGAVYFAFGSYCTMPIYHGWLFGYDKATLERKLIWCTTPNGKEGSIWQSGQGIAYDGRYGYVVSANGYWKPGSDWGNSFMKLDLTKVVQTGQWKGIFDVANGVVDYFTPYNWEELWRLDLDLGTAGPILIPDTDLVFACSKQGYCYLVNKNDMGHHSDTTNVNIQTFKPNPNSGTDYPRLNTGTHGGTCTWKTDKGTIVYVWPIEDAIKGFVLEQNGRLGRFNLDRTIKGPDMNPPVGFPGGIISLSANGYNRGTGILWATHSIGGSSNRQLKPGILRAYNAETLEELWNSNMNPCRDNSGELAKFNTPVVMNGRVYVASSAMPPNRDTKVYVYGVLPADQQNKPFFYDPCCLDRYACGGFCCNGACYDPNLYYCSNHVVCQQGQVCGGGNPCDRCPNSCCNNVCYNPNEFTCVSNKLCRVGQAVCGAAKICYTPKTQDCQGGAVVPRADPPPFPEPTRSSPTPRPSQPPPPTHSPSVPPPHTSVPPASQSETPPPPPISRESVPKPALSQPQQASNSGSSTVYQLILLSSVILLSFAFIYKLII